MKKHDCVWLLLCLTLGVNTSCSDKKSSADEQELGVTTVLPDAKQSMISMAGYYVENSLGRGEKFHDITHTTVFG